MRLEAPTLVSSRQIVYFLRRNELSPAVARHGTVRRELDDASQRIERVSRIGWIVALECRHVVFGDTSLVDGMETHDARTARTGAVELDVRRRGELCEIHRHRVDDV